MITEEQTKVIREEHNKEIEKYQKHLKTCPLCWLKYWDELKGRING